MLFLFFLILLCSQFLFTYSLTPLSECTQGRITAYTGYENGGSCDFGVPKMYGASPNQAFYNNGEKCGICYELIAPDGVLYFMVDNYCPIKGNEEACSGDMFHFDLSKNGFDSVVKDNTLGKLNITFRMVACNHKGNIILKTKKEVSQYYYSFVVRNHILGLKKVFYSFDNQNWVGLEREGDHNHWTVPENIKLPIYFKFKSITGEEVSTQIGEIKSDFEHDTGVQFTVPKDKYFDVNTLEQIVNPKKEDCCKLDDAYTDIYYEGKFLGEWMDVSDIETDKKNIEYNTGCYQGNKCIKVEMANWKCFHFYNRIKSETKRYEAIEFYLKSEKECNECLSLKLDDKEFIRISTEKPGVWEKKVIALKDLGVSGDKFRSFLFQGRIIESQIFYFDNIRLIKSSYVDNGICYDDNGNNDKNSGKYLNLILYRFLLLSLLILL